MIPVAKPMIGVDEIAAVTRVLESGNLAQGIEVETFEIEFANQTLGGVPTVAVNSGTSALHLSLLAAGIGPGDEVIVPSFTFAATANAVRLTGALPIFADIELDFYCLCPEAVAALIGPRTKAVMPVHLYGQPAELVKLLDICHAHGLLLIEDAAQAHGAHFEGKPVGTFGSAAGFSFYPTKNMTSGEGGMVSSNSPELIRTLKLLRNQGQEVRYMNEIVGFNNRMTDVHAAIGRVQLSKLPEWTRKRVQNANFFDTNLGGVVKPAKRANSEHVYHQYTIRLIDHDRDEFVNRLTAMGIGTGVYYPKPVHELAPYQRSIDLPATSEMSATCLSIPVHPSLTPPELEKIVDCVNKLANAGS